MIKARRDRVTKSEKKVAEGKEISRAFLRISGFGFSHFGIILNILSLTVQKISVAHLVVSIIAVVIALTMVEVLIRIYEEEKYDFSACQSLDRDFHHVMIANSVCRFKTEEWDVMYKINSLGLRDEEALIEKTDRFRILLLGDSFAQGYGVEAEESFGEVLESLLNQSDTAHYEVINAGVFGYSPLTEYLYLRQVGIKFDPDMVILAVSLTDFFEDRQRFSELKLSNPGMDDQQIKKLISDGKAQFVWTTSSVSKSRELVFKLKRFLRKNVKTYEIVADYWGKEDIVQQDVIHQGDIDRDILALVRGDKIDDSDWEKLWELPTEHIFLMKRFLDDEGIALVVVAIPDAFLVSDREWPGRKSLGVAREFSDPRGDWQKELSRRLTKQSILFIDLLDDFRQSGVYPLFFSVDGHFRASGHRLAASIIYRELVKHFANLQ